MAKTRKRPTADEIHESLTVETFGIKKSEADSEPSTDPVTPTPMVVRLDEFDEYDHNPRQTKNPLFQQIYERIIAENGLTDVLNITRRPGAEKYILSAGGNTRLTALKQVYSDTQNKVFSSFQALFIPYESEAKILISHIAENNQRAGLSFIESALSVIDAQRYLEEEHSKTYSERELEQQFKLNGYSVDRKSLRLYRYAVDHLVEHMPKILYAGIGHPRIQEIKNIETQMWNFAEFKGVKRDSFDLLFQQTLRQNDSDEVFQVEHVKNGLIMGLSDALDLDIGTFEYELDGFIEEGPDSVVFQHAPMSDSMQSNFAGNTTDSLQNEVAQSIHHPRPTSLNRLLDSTGIRGTATGYTPTVPVSNPFDHINSLRKRICRLVERLAIAFDIAPCVRLNHTIGHGYVVDFPPKKLIDEDPAANLWWVLYQTSGIHDDREHRYSILPDDLVLKQAFLKDPDQLEAVFYEHVGPPDLMAFSTVFLNNTDIEPRHCKDLLDLSFTARELLITAKTHGLTQELWAPHK